MHIFNVDEDEDVPLSHLVKSENGNSCEYRAVKKEELIPGKYLSKFLYIHLSFENGLECSLNLFLLSLRCRNG